MPIFKDSYPRRLKEIEYEIKNECWICTSHYKDKEGYPTVRRDEKNMRMSWYIFKLKTGNYPKEGNVILHSCDNPTCINPEHLSEGTYLDNRLDMLNKERPTNLKNAEEHYKSVELESCKEIRKLLLEGLPQNDIAERLKVAQSLVSKVYRGKHWSEKELGKFDKTKRPRFKKSNQKLSESDVREIKSLLKSGMAGREIEKIFNISSTTVSQIKTGKKWKHITNT